MPVKGHDKKEPKKWFQTYLTKHNLRAIRMGKDPEWPLNGSMAADKRVDVLQELVDALEKSFPVTDLTGTRIRGLKKLELKCMSELDEHFEAIYNYLSDSAGALIWVNPLAGVWSQCMGTVD